MRRWKRGLLVCAGVLAVVPAVFAEGRNKAPAATLPCPGWQGTGEVKIIPDPRARFTPEVPVEHPKQPNDLDEGFVEDLVSILNETRSPDAFLVTLSILQEIKPDARAVVPIIIRNAERLRLFMRTAPDKGTEQQRMIVECISELMRKDREPAAPRPGSPATAELPGISPGAIGGVLGGVTGALIESPANASPEPLNPPEPAEESEAPNDLIPVAATKGPRGLTEEDVLRVLCHYLEQQGLGRGKPLQGEPCVGRVKSSAVVVK